MTYLFGAGFPLLAAAGVLVWRHWKRSDPRPHEQAYYGDRD